MQFVLYLIRCILEIFAFFGNAGKSMKRASTGMITLVILGVVYVMILALFLKLKEKRPKLNLTKGRITLFTIIIFILVVAVFVLLSVVIESILGPPSYISG